MAKKTYAQTHKDFQEGLEKHGWKVQRTNKSSGKPLVVPYATSPDGQHRLWFKSQSVHLSGGGSTLGEAHTLTYADLRDLNFDDFHKVVQHRTVPSNAQMKADFEKSDDPAKQALAKGLKSESADEKEIGAKVKAGEERADKQASSSSKPPAPKPPEPSKTGLAKFQQAKEAKATDLNKHSLFEHMNGADRATNQVSPTSAPHIRRALKAGLAKIEGKELVLTDEGKKEQAAHEAKEAPRAADRAKNAVAEAQNILNIAKKDNDPSRIADAERLLQKKQADLQKAEERHVRLKGKGGGGEKEPEQHSLETGTRGGRYYVSATGEKVYVK